MRRSAGLRRRVAGTLTLGAWMAAGTSLAQSAPFELSGPELKVQVTRAGQTLPIGRVPSLAPGDTIIVRGALPENQSTNFMLMSAFLRGATNPPPEEWIDIARIWKSKEKDNTLTLTVPPDARQLVLLMVPETGGAEGVLEDAVRGKPGEFVRASQDLNQASLDHSRLTAFMAAIRAQDDSGPEYLRTVAPVLARSLSIKLQEDCLLKVIELQASCLVQNRETLVLNDVHTSSLADTLTGTPTDLALRLSATKEAGGGYYSPYIAVARDVARIFGAFSNPQFNYLASLTMRQDDRLSLLLNAAPSFQKPKSVMVAAMPAIEADIPPQLRSAAKGPICLSAGAVLPIEGAPLIYSTDFAHAMKVTLTASSGQTVEVPVTPRADKGGYVLSGDPLPESFSGDLRARLHGSWGFIPFDGPDFILQRPGGKAWQPVSGAGALVAGRSNELLLEGPAPACVEGVMLRRADGSMTPLTWKNQDGRRLSVTVPLDETASGELSVEVRQRGRATAEMVPVQVQKRNAPARPEAEVLARTIYPGSPSQGARSLTLTGKDLLPDNGEVVFSLRGKAGLTFARGDAVEIASAQEEGIARLTLGKGLKLESADVAVASLRAADLPAGTFGPLRFRIVREGKGAPGEWQPLVTLVRLPRLEGVTCDAQKGQCTVAGRDLFLVAAVAADDAFARGIVVQPGYTGRTLTVPHQPTDGSLRLRLRDDPASVIRLPLDR